MRLLDLDQPVAVLAIALFHFVSDTDDPSGILSRLTKPLVQGSYVALSHGTSDGPQAMATMMEISRRAGVELTFRTHRDVEALFGGWDLVEPGVVWLPQWRPESSDDLYYDEPSTSGIYAGIARKP